MLNDNLMLPGMAHSKLVAINATHKFARPGEVRKERQRAPFSDNLIVRHDAEAARKRIAVDLDPRWFLAGNVDGKVHAKIAAISFGSASEAAQHYRIEFEF